MREFANSFFEVLRRWKDIETTSGMAGYVNLAFGVIGALVVVAFAIVEPSREALLELISPEYEASTHPVLYLALFVLMFVYFAYCARLLTQLDRSDGSDENKPPNRGT